MLKLITLLGCASIVLLIIVGAVSPAARTEYKARSQEAGQVIAAEASKVGTSVDTIIHNDEISGNLKQALLQHDDLELSKLDVETKGHVVTLRGDVPTEIQNQQTEKLARDLLGADYTVDDELSVPSPE